MANFKEGDEVELICDIGGPSDYIKKTYYGADENTRKRKGHRGICHGTHSNDPNTHFVLVCFNDEPGRKIWWRSEYFALDDYSTSDYQTTIPQFVIE